MFKTILISMLIASPTLAGVVDIHQGVTTGDTQIVVGSINGVQAQPWNTTGAYLKTTGTGTFTYDFGKATRIGLLIGSVDSYNSIGLLDENGVVYKTISYTGTGDQGASGNLRQIFNVTSGRFSGFQFNSSQPALEVGNITESVPEPTSWVLLIAGFLLTGVALRNRKTYVTA